MNRDELRGLLRDRQANVCIVCGHGMYGDAAIHEAIIKRGDLPDDPRVFHECNCVVLHNGCHENTKRVDRKAIAYLIGHYGIEAIFQWICSLEMVVLPGRASEIAEKQKQRTGEYI